MEANEKSEISDLKRELKKIKAENKKLRTSLEEANAIVNSLKNIFTEGQIKKMIVPSMLYYFCLNVEP